MMEKLSRFVSGTATARVRGDTARFLNVCVRSGVQPLEVKHDGGTLFLTVRARQYKRLHTVKLRTAATVRLQKKGGLPFFALGARRRPGLFLGAALAVAFYIFLSGFYWGVSVEGEAPYAKADILKAAAACGAEMGVPRGEFDSTLAAAELLRLLPKLSSASFNTEGCFITLSVRTAIEKAEGIEHDGVCDIVAARDGVITRIAAESGTVMVKPGSAVVKGQVLVSGATIVGNPYDELPEVTLLSRARASVFAETRHSFTAECPLEAEGIREEETGVRRALSVLGVRVALPSTGIPADSRLVHTEEPLVLLGVELPVSLLTVRGIRDVAVPVTFTPEQAKARALEKARQLRENMRGDTGTLLFEEVAFTEQDGVITARADCVFEENIAQAAPYTPRELEIP